MLNKFDAHEFPHEDNSKDVIIIFEAIYYLNSFKKFINECKRVLRKNGILLIATANKDLYDFNPSPFTYKYYGVTELNSILRKNGFETNCYGHLSTYSVSIIQKLLRPIKKIAINLNIVPKSMTAKKILKKIVFGGLVSLPHEIKEGMLDFKKPKKLCDSEPNKEFKVILCEAKLFNQD